MCQPVESLFSIVRFRVNLLWSLSLLFYTAGYHQMTSTPSHTQHALHPLSHQRTKPTGFLVSQQVRDLAPAPPPP